jgi:hypothetical protein
MERSPKLPFSQLGVVAEEEFHDLQLTIPRSHVNWQESVELIVQVSLLRKEAEDSSNRVEVSGSGQREDRIRDRGRRRVGVQVVLRPVQK